LARLLIRPHAIRPIDHHGARLEPLRILHHAHLHAAAWEILAAHRGGPAAAAAVVVVGCGGVVVFVEVVVDEGVGRVGGFGAAVGLCTRKVCGAHWNGAVEAGFGADELFVGGLRAGPHAGEGEEDGDDGGDEAVNLDAEDGVVADDGEDDWEECE